MDPSLRLLLQAAGGASPTSTSPVANASGSSPSRASTLPAIAPRPQASLLPSVDAVGATGLPDGQDSNAMAPAETSQQRVSAAVHSLHALTAPRTSPAVASKPSTAAGVPLIAKRRRRTSPAELAILEIEFRCNPLPSQSQRNDIAAKVGMTGRAAQVWFQNRRQKEKKEGTYLGSSAGSACSAPDPDHDGTDFDAPSVGSSSPTHSTFSTFLPSGEVPSVLAPARHVVVSPPTAPLPPPPIAIATPSVLAPLVPSVYTALPDNKENLAVPCPLVAAPARVPDPSLAASFPDAIGGKQHASVYGTYPQPRPVATRMLGRETFQHRSSNASEIVAKKYVHKRPPGGLAPLARQPSLSHNFDFPPSPPRRSTVTPTLKRSRSSVSVGSSGSGGRSLLMTNESGRARVWVDALNADVDSHDNDGIDDAHDGSAPPKSKVNDEVWRHMQSDPPSSFSPTSSPAPLTRKAINALSLVTSNHAAIAYLQTDSPNLFDRTQTRGRRPDAASLSNVPNLLSTVTAKGRKTLVRSHSMGGTSARAEGEEACAVKAWERKRARMGDDGQRRTEAAAASDKRNKLKKTSSGVKLGPHSSKTAASKKGRVSLGDSSMEMGDLSFSSTSTAHSEAVGTPKADAGSYFPRKASPVGRDEERECAELLLGLGGFF